MKLAIGTEIGGLDGRHQRVHRPAGAIFGAVALALALTPGVVAAGTYALFGPEELTHPRGRPSLAVRTFDAPNPGPGHTLELRAGGDAAERPPSWAIVILNEERVIASRLSRNRPVRIEKSVTLGSENRLEVFLGGRSGSVSLAVLGEDDEPPTIVGTVTPAPNAAGWNASPVTVSFECDDGESGIASCTEPVALVGEGSGQVVIGTAVDVAGNVSTTAVLANIDVTPPTLIVDQPIDGSEAIESPIASSGLVADNLSGVAAAWVDGMPLALANGEFEQDVPLASGLNVLEYLAEDVAGNVTTVLVSVRLTAPLIRLEFVAPGPGSVQYNSGWPIGLRLTLPRNSQGGRTRIGVDTYDQELVRVRADFTPSPEDHNTAVLPRDGHAAVAVFEDPDGCLSFIGYEPRVGGSDHECHPVGSLIIGEAHVCSEDPPPTCSNAVFPFDGALPCDRVAPGRALRCPDEIALRFRPGSGVGRGGLPALVLLSDTGPGHRVLCCSSPQPDGSCEVAPRECDGSRLVEADNLAEWDSVAYQRLDELGETSIDAHMTVPFGLLAPVVDLDESIADPSPCGASSGGLNGDQFCYRVDGGPLCPSSSTPDCGITAVAPVVVGIPGEPRMDDLYIPIFDAKPVTLRAFVVDLKNTFDEEGVDKLWDANGDGVVEAQDAVRLDYELLSNEVVLTVHQRYATSSFAFQGRYDFAGTCDEVVELGLELPRYAGLHLLRFRDLDGDGASSACSDQGCSAFETCGGDSSGPGGTDPPPD